MFDLTLKLTTALDGKVIKEFGRFYSFSLPELYSPHSGPFPLVEIFEDFTEKMLFFHEKDVRKIEDNFWEQKEITGTLCYNGVFISSHKTKSLFILHEKIFDDVNNKKRIRHETI